MIIGRSSKADFQICNPYVGSRHATLEEDQFGVFTLRDLKSTNGTFLNSLEGEVHGAVTVTENDLIYFSDHYKVSAGHLIRFLRDIGRARVETTEADRGSVRVYTNERIVVGSDPSCDLHLAYLSVLKRHAEFLQVADGRKYLRPLEGSVFVNGAEHSAGRTVMLSPRDRVEIGGVSISVEFDPSDSGKLTIGAQREGIYFELRDLQVTIKDRDTRENRDLLKNISLSVYPGELVGLLGPSGCGKTTLLNALSGSARPTGGQVLYNGVDLYDNLPRFANQTGYVPQDDIMHAELKVWEVLHYNARLRLPASVSDSSIRQKIDSICSQLGLRNPKPELDLQNQLIGSPTRKVLSGGQKKRVNLGIELLTDPRALFLDEPTSGLSSFDTRMVMESLRALATEKGIAIIITIHQPSPAVYKLFDHVIYLQSGRLAYFGPSFPESITHFVPDVDPAITGPDGVMEKIDQLPAEEMERTYRNSGLWHEFVERRRKAFGTVKESAGDFGTGGNLASALVQISNLVQRCLLCKLRDLPALAVLMVQAPLVAAFLAIAFHGRELNAPLFLLGFVSIWFGTNNSAREIVGERDILARELRCGLGTAQYLISKWLVHGIILLVQCTLLVVLTRWFLQFDASLMLAIPVCFVAGLVGVGVGLLISALARSEVTAIVSVPLILIPVIMFGGLVAPYDQARTATRMLSNLMPSRWAYEALIHAEALERADRTPKRSYEELEQWKEEQKGRNGQDKSKTQASTRKPYRPLYRLNEFSREPFKEFLPTEKDDESYNGKYYVTTINPVFDSNINSLTNREMFDWRLPMLPADEFAAASKMGELERFRRARILWSLAILTLFSAACGVAALLTMRRRRIK